MAGKMIEEEKYFDYLYQALISNKIVPNSNLWRENLEYVVSFLKIDRDYIKRLKEEYSAQFSDVVLVNSTKNILLCKGINNPISKELCAISVYFSLLGCLIDFWVDSGIEDLRIKGIQKLSWNKCKIFFQDFNDKKNIEDIADELFLIVGKGMHTISIDNPEVYKYLLKLIRKVTVSEVTVAEKSFNAEEDMIYNKSVLFVEIALLIAIGNKTDLKKEDYCALKKIGLLYAYIDDIIDIYEDINNNQGNIFVKRLYAGESYKTIIDTSIQQISTLICEIREYFGDKLAEFLLNEISDWIFTNKNLMRKIHESRG